MCSPNVYELMVASKEAEAKSYLQQVRARVSDDRLQIKTVTSISHLPAAIIEHAKRLNVDLIIMSSHGQSGIRRRSYGSVIEKVLCSATCVTLVIRAQEPIVHEDDRVRVKGV